MTKKEDWLPLYYPHCHPDLLKMSINEQILPMGLLNSWPLTSATSVPTVAAVAVVCGLILTESVRESGKEMMILCTF